MGVRVLVVDDEENQVKVLSMGLRLEGFDVETAHSAEEAMERLGHESVDLALLDLMMPKTNGLELARQLRDLHPSVRVVLTSAYHISERQLARADCGVIGFMPKPFQLTDLAHFLRTKMETPLARMALHGRRSEQAQRLRRA